VAAAGGRWVAEPVRQLLHPAGRPLCGCLTQAMAPVSAAAGARARLDCSSGCELVVRPVCGSRGLSYVNRCVASCAGAAIVADGYCPGTSAGMRAHPAASKQQSQLPPYQLLVPATPSPGCRRPCRREATLLRPCSRAARRWRCGAAAGQRGVPLRRPGMGVHGAGAAGALPQPRRADRAAAAAPAPL